MAFARTGTAVLVSLVVLFNDSALGQVKSKPQSTQVPRPAELVKTSMPAIVLITGDTAQGKTMLGSGFVVDSSGIIITNLHVIKGLIAARVRLSNGDSFDKLTVRAFDEAKDLAILQVPAFGLPSLPLGNSDAVEQGDSVILIGSPLGLQGTVSAGLISAIRRTDTHRVFQTDAAANPGNSGGPMLNERGEVVGVLTFGLNGENLNFAVPVNYARGLMSLNESLSLTQLNERVGLVSAVESAKANVVVPEQPKAEESVATPQVATVYVFRVSELKGMGIDPPFYVNDAEYAKVDSNRFFWFDAQPGSYVLRSSCGKTPTLVQIEAPKTYYFAVQYDSSCSPWIVRFRVYPVDPTVGATYVAQMKPLNPKEVRHSSVRIR